MPKLTKQNRTSELSAFELSPITDYNKNRGNRTGAEKVITI
jgi:hypothetical protein